MSPAPLQPWHAWVQRLRALMVGALLLIGLIVTISHLGEVEQFARLARAAEPSWLLLALLLQAGTYVSAAGVWYLSLRRLQCDCSLASLVPLGVAKLFSDQALPSAGASGTAFFVAALKRQGLSGEHCLGALLVSLVSFHLAFMGGAIAALALLWQYHAVQPWIVVLVSMFAVVSLLLIAATLIFARWSERLPLWLRRIPGVATATEMLERAPRGLLHDPMLLLQTSLLHMSVFLLDAATLWVMLRAIGLPSAYGIAFSSYMLATVAASVSLIPLGLGSFEATCVIVLGLLGIRVEPALAATLLLRGFTLWLPMLPGMFLARRALR